MNEGLLLPARVKGGYQYIYIYNIIYLVSKILRRLDFILEFCSLNSYSRVRSKILRILKVDF